MTDKIERIARALMKVSDPEGDPDAIRSPDDTCKLLAGKPEWVNYQYEAEAFLAAFDIAARGDRDILADHNTMLLSLHEQVNPPKGA